MLDRKIHALRVCLRSRLFRFVSAQGRQVCSNCEQVGVLAHWRVGCHAWTFVFVRVFGCAGVAGRRHAVPPPWSCAASRCRCAPFSGGVQSIGETSLGEARRLEALAGNSRPKRGMVASETGQCPKFLSLQNCLAKRQERCGVCRFARLGLRQDPGRGH